MLKVFVSSTYTDLKDVRQKVSAAITRLGLQAIGMEGSGPDERPPLEVSLRDVRSADVYVGILAWRYGTVPRGCEKSITHLEYEEAGKKGIDRLMFLLEEEALWPRSKMDDDPTAIHRFRQIVTSENTAKLFRSPNEICLLVETALRNHPKSRSPTRPNRLLYYLSDRGDQKKVLLAAFAEAVTEQRPLLCIVHGDENESHGAFLHCVQERFLPQALPASGLAIRELPVKWAPREGDVPQRLNQMLESLRNYLIGWDGSQEDLMRAFNSYRDAHLMISTRLNTRVWLPNDLQLVKAWFEFWHSMPLAANRLSVFVVIQYALSSRRAVLERNGEFRGFFKASAAERELGIACLPELCAVNFNDAVSWVREHAEGWLRRNGYDIYRPTLEEAVEQLYQDSELITPQERIPMSRLSRELQRIAERAIQESMQWQFECPSLTTKELGKGGLIPAKFACRGRGPSTK